MATNYHTKSKSIIKCSLCGEICHEDLVNSILSTDDISSCQLFRDNESSCFVCHHGVNRHARSINEEIVKRLFTDAKVNGNETNADNICQRIKYLGDFDKFPKKSKQIINMLRINNDAPYLWMNILWKSYNYTTPKQKLHFIKLMEKEFEPDYSLTNPKGWNLIHILCNNANIIDVETSKLILIYLIEESKICPKSIFTAQDHFNKRTPLHYAVEFKRIQCIQILINKNIYHDNHLMLKDSKRQTLMDIAKQQKHHDIISLLHKFVGDEDEKKQDLYHEKQEWEMCLLHAINSLLQTKQFTQKQLDNICKELAPDKIINPHKSILQTGNYDANVLIMALKKINIDVQWFDARKVDQLDLNDKKLYQSQDKNQQFIGFILNNPQKAMFKIFNRRHWLTIKKIDHFWYNLDSKLKEPHKFKDSDETTNFIKECIKENNAELMICRKIKEENQSTENDDNEKK